MQQQSRDYDQQENQQQLQQQQQQLYLSQARSSRSQRQELLLFDITTGKTTNYHKQENNTNSNNSARICTNKTSTTRKRRQFIRKNHDVLVTLLVIFPLLLLLLSLSSVVQVVHATTKSDTIIVSSTTPSSSSSSSSRSSIVRPNRQQQSLSLSSSSSSLLLLSSVQRLYQFSLHDQQNQQQPRKTLISSSSSPPILFRTWGSTFPIKIPRGGAITDDEDDEYDDDEEEEEEEEDDDDMLFGSFDDDDVDIGLMGDDIDNMNNVRNSDFTEDNTIDRMIDSWKNKTPPLTKIYLGSSFFVTLYAYVFNHNEFPSILLLDWKKVIMKFQWWRIFTSFLNFGPAGLGYLMTAQFVWVYMSTLERLNHNKPYDFWIMILFGQLCMIIGYPIFRLNPKFLGHNISTFLVYIWSRYHEGLQVNLFELFNTRAELLPWFFLAQTFLLEGELPILDFLGIVFGHIYHHCYTTGILHAPSFIQHWYHEGNTTLAIQIRELYKPVSADFDIVQ